MPAPNRRSAARNARFPLPVLALAALAFAAGACRMNSASSPSASEPATAVPAETSGPGESPGAPSPAPAPRDTTRGRVVVLGNSIAAGYGLASPRLAFPALLQARVDSLGWPFRVENAGVSGETTAGGLARLDWLLQTPVDVLIVELGGNDGLRGVSPASTRSNLTQIVTRTRARYPDARVVLAGMQIPPNLGGTYVRAFSEVFPAVARETGATLIPFVLEGVGGMATLNQPDRIHPTAEGQRIVAATVWRTLGPVLDEIRADREGAPGSR